jgi:F1F0 ATPase subunit 2
MVLAFIAGIGLGTFFFGGLWFTVKKAVASKYAAVWFLGSSLARTGIVLMGFYYAAQGNWQRLLVCVAGFIAARFLVIWFTKSFEQKNSALIKTEQQ